MIEMLIAIDKVVWGPVMLVILVGTGFYLTLRTRFLCWRYFFKAIRHSFSKDAHNSEQGAISPFASLCISLASTIGTGNIAGVATALAFGGPGALVWMWISALFGITTKFAECALASYYRIKNDKGEYLGGPMLTIERGLPQEYGVKCQKPARIMAVLYALFTAFAAFGIGNLTQGNSISDVAKVIIGDNGGRTALVVGVLIGLATLFIVVGGIDSISKISMKLVPFMALLYFGGAFVVILLNVDKVPAALMTMIRMAFSLEAVGGGISGSVVASFAQAMNNGIARGCFSNEAGMGSAAIICASSAGDSYIEQGYNASTSIFWDTFVICTGTGLAILTSGAMDFAVVNGETVLKGAPLVMKAFELSLGPMGSYLVGMGILLFSFSTIVGWEVHGEKALEYLSKSTKISFYYRILYSFIAFVGCITAFEVAWYVSDILNALMIIPNVISLLLLVRPLYKGMIAYHQKKW